MTFVPIDNQFMFCFGRICDPGTIWERLRRRPGPKEPITSFKNIVSFVFFLLFFSAWSKPTPAHHPSHPHSLTFFFINDLFIPIGGLTKKHISCFPLNLHAPTVSPRVCLMSSPGTHTHARKHTQASKQASARARTHMNALVNT